MYQRINRNVNVTYKNIIVTAFYRGAPLSFALRPSGRPYRASDFLKIIETSVYHIVNGDCTLFYISKTAKNDKGYIT